MGIFKGQRKGEIDFEKNKKIAKTINNLGLSSLCTIIIMFLLELTVKFKWFLWLSIFIAVYLGIKKWRK